jgi:hypothetical protein
VLRIAPDAGTGWAAVPGLLLLVNGLALAVPALVLRRRIPGLPAARLFFVPLGSALVPTAGASAQQHLVGLAAALTLHAALAARMRRPERAPA